MKKMVYGEAVVDIDSCFMPQRKGYAFGGYYADKEGTDLYYGSDLSHSRIWNNTATRDTLYAKWEPVTYYLRYNVQGGRDNRDTMRNIRESLVMGDIIELSPYEGYVGSEHNMTCYPCSGVNCDATTNNESPAYGYRSKCGYVFQGWSTDSNVVACGSVSQKDDHLYYFISAGDSTGANLGEVLSDTLIRRITDWGGGIGGALTLYAMWCPDTTLLEFVDNHIIRDQCGCFWNTREHICSFYGTFSRPTSINSGKFKVVYGQALPNNLKVPIVATNVDACYISGVTDKAKFFGYYKTYEKMNETDADDGDNKIYYDATVTPVPPDAVWYIPNREYTLYARWTTIQYKLQYKCQDELLNVGSNLSMCSKIADLTTDITFTAQTDKTFEWYATSSGDPINSPVGLQFMGWKVGQCTPHNQGDLVSNILYCHGFTDGDGDGIIVLIANPVYEQISGIGVSMLRSPTMQLSSSSASQPSSSSASQPSSSSPQLSRVSASQPSRVSDGQSSAVADYIPLWSFTTKYGDPLQDVEHKVLLPRVKGYAFDGYFTSDSIMYFDALGHTYPADRTWTVIPGYLEFYPHWHAHQYNIRYNVRGGSMDAPTGHTAVKYDSIIELQYYDGSKYGYSFAGWSLDSTGKETIYEEGTEAYNLTADDGVEINLYAVWQPVTSFIFFNANGGTGGQSSLMARYGEAMPALTANPQCPTRKGHTFMGYAYSGKLYYDSVGNGLGAWDKMGAITMLAQWEATSYSIVYDIQGGSAAAPARHTGVLYDSIVQLRTYSGAKTGYTFAGWSLTAGAKVGQYAAGSAAKGISAVHKSTATLYAAWDPHKTALTFNPNGGNFPIYLDGQLLAEYGERMPMFMVFPSRVGYEFAGIYDAPIGGKQYYTEYATSARTWDKMDEATTLYVQWRPLSTQLQYDGNGGIGAPAGTYTVYYNAELPAISAPARIGYTFLGFYDDNESGEMYYDSTGASVKRVWDKVSRKATMYALWRAKTTVLDFDFNGGTGGDATSRIATYGNDLPRLSTLPTRTGYNFAGYFADKEWSEQYYDEQGIGVKTWNQDVERKTLYAQWGGTRYDITYYNMPAGLVGELPTVYLTGTGLDLPAASHNQYTFDGFYLDSAFAGAAVTRISPTDTGAKAFYTKWTYTVEYDLNGGSGTPLPSGALLYNVASAIYGVPEDWVREGYECAGWSMSPDATEAMIPREGGVSTGLPVNKVVRLYAVWVAGKSRITLSLGETLGGGFAQSNPEVTAQYGSAMPDVDVPVRDGYVFAGYYDALEGGTQYYTSSGAGAKVWDKSVNTATLYARWVYQRADNLQGLLASAGRLYPSFASNVYEYKLVLPCEDVTLALQYADGNTVKVNGTAVGRNYLIEAYPAYSTVQIEVSSDGKASTIYTIKLDVPLNSDYILYDPDHSPTRMEVADGGYDSYQWYEDGAVLSGATAIVLSVGLKAGSVYSATAYSGGDSVRICGVTAVTIASSGTEKVWSAAPNPATTVITVTHPDLGKESTVIKIYSAGSGSLVLSYTAESGSGTSVQIDVSMLAGGSYIIDVFGSRKMIVKQ
jgi:hypothetical protein